MGNDLRKMAKWCIDKLDEAGWVGANCKPIIEAYLEEHPADDNKPITRKWLRKIGFVDTKSHIGPEYDNDMQKGVVRVWNFNDQYWLLTKLDSVGCELRTRRQMRLLLEVFKE